MFQDPTTDHNAREVKIAELLDESETFLERNMNTAANGLSLMALHAFELST